MKKCIVVLGMHRSGTSVLSGLISLLGCNIGMSDTMPKRKDNPKGFFENYRIYKFNQLLLEDNGVSWDEYEFSSDDLDDALFNHYVRQAKEIIEQEFASDELFFIKDPRMCILLPIWQKALQELNIECKCIIVHRSPLEVALSLKDRNLFTKEKSLMIWSHHFFQSELKSRDCDRIFVKYNQDFQSLDKLLLTLTDFIGVNLTEEKRKKAKEFYSPKLQHQKLAIENISNEIPEYLKIMVDLILKSKLDSPASLDKIREDFNQSIKYYLHNEKNLIHNNSEISNENNLLKVEKQKYLREEIKLLQQNQKVEKFVKIQADSIVALNSKMETLQLDKQKAEKRVKSQTEEIVEKNSKIEILQLDKQKAEKRVKSQTEEIVEKNSKIEILQLDKQKTEKHVKSQAEEIVEKNSKIEILQLDKQKAEKRVKSQTEEIVEKNSKIEILQLDKQKTEKHVKSQAEDIVELNRKVKSLLSDNQKIANEYDNLKHNNRLLTHDLTDLQHRNNQAKEREIKNTSFFSELKKRLVVADSLINKVINDKSFFKKITHSTNPTSNIKHIITSVLSNKQGKQILYDRKTILDSGYFSPLYYITKYRDVWRSGVDPLAHFCHYGWKEARDPNPAFNTKDYLKNNPDVAKLQLNPLVHFIAFGEKEKRETGYEFPMGEYDADYKLKIAFLENKKPENKSKKLPNVAENVDKKEKNHFSKVKTTFSIDSIDVSDAELESGELLDFKDGYVTGWYSPSLDSSLPIIKIDNTPTLNFENTSNIPNKNGFLTQAINSGKQANIELFSLSEKGLTSLHTIKSKNQWNLVDKFVDLKQALEICKDPKAVAITVWEGAHNPIGRAKVLYDIVAKNRPVILFAYVFGDFGADIWQPLKNTNMNVVLIPYAQRFEYQTIIQQQDIKFNTVWICKYRLHSFELACMVSHSETACILDIDDNEDIFISSKASKYKPYGIFSKNKANYFLQKTAAKSVASTSINKIHGGKIVRHARSQHSNKSQRKKDLDKLTAVFIGTIRPHKNIPELVNAINKYNQTSSQSVTLAIGGDFNPASLKQSLQSPYSSIIGEVASEDLYETLLNHDVVITGYPDENDENNAINKLQITAKIGDALAIGRPVLTPETEAVSDLSNIPGLFLFTRRNFNQQLTKALNYYQTISLPKEFTLDYSYQTFLKLEKFAQSNSQAKHIFGLDPFYGYSSNQAYNNENIVLVWKQHDSGIYGRRIDHIARYYKQNNPKCKVTVLEFVSEKELTNLMQSDVQFDNFSMVLNDALSQKLYSYIIEGVEYKLITYADTSGWNSFDDKFNSYLRSEKLLPNNTVLILFPLHKIFNQMISIVKDYKIIVDLVDNQIKWITGADKKIEGLKQYYHLISIADEIVSNSSQNLKYFQDKGFFEAKSPKMIPNWYTVPNSVDFKRKVPTDEINLIYSGNLNDRIDWDLLDKICKILKYKNGYLHIVGTSVRSSDSMKKLLDNPNCIYHGVVNEFQLIRLLQHINFTVVPHVEDSISKFMDPIKLKMYKKLGIKSLVSDLPGLPKNDPMIIVAQSAHDFTQILEGMLNKIDQNSSCNLIKEKNDNIANEYSNIIKSLFDKLFEEDSLRLKTSKNHFDKNNKDYYSGVCSVCGNKGEFIKRNRSFREGYHCSVCQSSMRYRGQALSILKSLSSNKDISLTELVKLNSIKSLSIYEPGLSGPFRKLFSGFKNYKNSFYWEEVKLGDFKDGIQCQSLEALTFENNSIDLIISSDILEHVRHPWVAIKEILRVLKPGGYHIFTIPYSLPMLKKTSYPVDTSTQEDVFIEEPRYHGNGLGGKSLVYTKFGSDTSKQLEELGFIVTEDTINSKHYDIKKLVTFITQKPHVRDRSVK